MFFMKIKLNLFYEDNAEISCTFIYCLTKFTPYARCHSCLNVVNQMARKVAFQTVIPISFKNFLYNVV